MKKIINLSILLCSVSLIFCINSCKKGADNKSDNKSVEKPAFTDIVKIRKITSAKKMGQVTMSHKKHTAMKIKCSDCHHKKDNEKNIKDCTKCHLDKKGDDKVMHKLCVECHKKQKKGPAKCLECHKKE